MHTVLSAQAAFSARQLTPSDLLEQCLAQIDKHEENVQAWVFVERDKARRDAARLTAEQLQGKKHGPLHGIPVGVKDIFDVEEWPTTAGAKRWAKSIAREDCAVVHRLREAGCIFLGKTVTTAYASFDPPVTRNPWDVSRTPGGSSSGSAAAVACGMCLIALASQTGGSTTRPASYCGISSLKPTFDQISLSGVVPLAPSLDHFGIFGQTLADLSSVYGVLEPARLAAGAAPPTQTLGLLGGLFSEKLEPTMASAFAEVCQRLRASGWNLHNVDTPPTFEEVTARQRTLMAVEANAYHRRRLAQHPLDYPEKITSLLAEGAGTTAEEYRACLQHQTKMKGLFAEQFANQMPYLLTPATLGPAPDATTTGDPLLISPWSYLGLPTVSLPFAWASDGLPLAVQLIGPPDREAELLALSAALETALAFPRRVC